MASSFSDEYTDLCKSCLKQMKAVGELNAKAFNHLTNNTSIDEFLGAKNAEDILEAQRRFVVEMNSLVATYTQELFNLMLESSSDVTKHFNFMASEVTKAATEATQTTTKPFKGSKSKEERAS